MSEIYKGARVLVTGGTGSIGSEIVRELLARAPSVVRVFSRDETKHYLLQEELGSRQDLRFLIGDIRDRKRLRRALEGIDFVFHAAALKHVPSCEYNPFEAVQTNVVGTQNVIDAALDAGVKRLVAISTDKAVVPTFTMGATKLLAEKIVTASQMWAKGLTLACVRFGNVLGSRGSVVPVVRAQVEAGKPVTITDPSMTRFVMSIRQAARLTLDAMERSIGGEVFILKQMAAVRVGDLVHAVVEEACARLGRDPKAVVSQVTKPRAGEKTHERLLTDEELTRVKNLGEMFVVHHFSAIERMEKFKPDRVAPSLYLSEKAKPRGRDWIRRMLREEKLV